MITFIQRIFKVNLNSHELETLSKAHLILDEIVTNAIKEELDGILERIIPLTISLLAR